MAGSHLLQKIAGRRGLIQPRLLFPALLLALLCLVGAAPLRSAPAQEEQVYDLSMSEAAPLVDSGFLRVFLVSYLVSNGFLIETPGGVTLFDAGLPTSARVIQQRLRAIGHEGELCQIYISHAHVDHYGAAADSRERTGARILVHQDDADDLADGYTRLGNVRNLTWSRQLTPFAERFARVRPAPPDQIVADGERLSSCGLDAVNATVMHTPGHTNGSTTLLLTDPATGLTYAFAGDLISTTNGAHMQSSYAESWLTLYDSIKALQALRPHFTFPGHGSTALGADTLAGLPPSAPIQFALDRAGTTAALR